MNKKLIALAVAGACIAPAAMAQTANPVTLYGRVYVMFESVEAKDGATPVVRRNRVSDQSSLLGVRGTEDLGGGLKAFFQLETAFKPDQNDTTFAARNSAVGLQGAFGSIFMGRWDTPWKSTTIAVDPYGDLTLAGITGALSGSGVRNVQGQFDRREQNVVQYWSPRWAGIELRLSYMANEGKTATLNPRSQGGSLTWTGGPVYVGAAYHEFKDIAFATVTPQTQKGEALFGSVSFGPAKVGAVYEKLKRDGFTDQKAWLANIVLTFGPHQIIYQYQNAKDGEANGAAVQPNCNINAPGYQYNFSKRTFFLAQYVRVNNKNSVSTCNFGANTITIAGGQDPQGVALGLRHIF